MSTFEPFPKIPRLNRDIVITEKIDGTNAQIVIQNVTNYVLGEAMMPREMVFASPIHEGDLWYIAAGSRKRWITPEDDNFGFARWVRDNVEELVKLGEGRHFGEWWGSGIQRGYGLEKGEKRFSLFNTKRWLGYDLPECVGVVPQLYEGPMDEAEIDTAIAKLRFAGSVAAPGFMKPEGIIVYHTAARQLFKVLLENDEVPKGPAG